MEVDLAVLKEAGYKLDTPVIVTNSDKFSAIIIENTGNITSGDSLITVLR